MSNLAMRNLDANFSDLLVGQHLHRDRIVSFHSTNQIGFNPFARRAA